MQVLIIDNYDSFTYNIYNYICICFKKQHLSLNNICVIKNNEKKLNEIIDLHPTHLVFGPGQGTVYRKEDIGISEEILDFFQGITENNIKIMRYHSQIGDKNTLPNNLEIIAQKNDIIMGIKHKKHKIRGLQFHPESIGTPKGLSIINNFIFN